MHESESENEHEPFEGFDDSYSIEDTEFGASTSDFVSYRTKMFFSSFELQTDFFDLDPSMWEGNEEYQTAFEFCKDLLVDNDAAERGVKFMKDYNRSLTRDEDEMQFILQVIDLYRKEYPSHTKSKLKKKSQT